MNPLKQKMLGKHLKARSFPHSNGGQRLTELHTVSQTCYAFSLLCGFLHVLFLECPSTSTPIYPLRHSLNMPPTRSLCSHGTIHHFYLATQYKIKWASHHCSSTAFLCTSLSLHLSTTFTLFYCLLQLSAYTFLKYKNGDFYLFPYIWKNGLWNKVGVQ